MVIRNNGETLNCDELKEIANNFFITPHAQQRLKQRNIDNEAITRYIQNPILAYFNTDSSISIAIDEFNYFVFAYNENEKRYILITFKEKSNNDINIFDKHRLAQMGIKRQNNNKFTLKQKDKNTND